MISRRGIAALITKHPEARSALVRWYGTVRKARWGSLGVVRATFSSADQVGHVLIFNVMGDNYRLITTVDYQSQRIYVKHLLTHREYERKEWMKWA